MSFIPSAQQQAIFDEFQFGTGNVIVVARAGTGKTTTAVKGVALAPEKNVLFTCFNKRIEVEGNKKLSALGIRTAKFQTLHSIGARIVYKFWEGVHPADDSRGEDPFARANNLTQAVCGSAAPDAIKRLVNKLHTLGREILPHATTGAELYELAEEFECVPDEQWEEMGFTLEYVAARAADAMELAASKKPADNLIDFSDMIFLPVRNKWLSKMYDMVVVDEAQDLTAAKLELAQGVCKGRMWVIGDNRQALYGFLGADVNSLTRLGRELCAKELKLTQTWRCGKRIVAEVVGIVPDFEAAPSNHDGEILELGSEKLTETAGPGDFILSRLNAPLVPIAMRLLRAGKRCHIAGQNIGKGLVALVKKLRGSSIPQFLTKLDGWQNKELTRLAHRYASKLETPAYLSRVDAIKEKAEMLASLTDGAKNMDEVITRIEHLFTDDGLGDAGKITCSSVHKAKGLEAKRVFVMADTLRDYSEEEFNIRYVACTRAIETLVYVRGL